MPSIQDIRRKLRASLGQDVGERLRVFDPVLGDSAEVVIDPGEPGGSKETTRLTLHVPHDNTMFSLGKPSGDWRADEGITARTDNHILLDVADDVKTFISLGKPSIYGQLAGLFGLAPVASEGYAMVTEGSAWSESQLSQVAVSQTGDAALHALKKKAVIQASTAEAEIGAEGGVCIGTPSSVTIAAHGVVKLPKITYRKDVDTTLKASSGAAVAQGQANWAVVLDTAVNAVSTVLPGLSLPGTDKGCPDWTPGSRSLMGVVFGAYNTAAGLGWVNALGSGANVDITAGESVSMSGGRSAGMYGHAAAGVSSLGFSSMFGTTAGVTGMVGLGLVGVAGAELASAKDASVRSLVDASVVGRRSVKIESPAGWVGVSSKDQTQVTSTGKTAVFGADHASLVAGYGEGHGVLASPEEIFVGHATSTKDLGGAKADSARGIKVTEQALVLSMKAAKLALSDSGSVLLQGSEMMEVKVGGAVGVTFKKSKILLG